MQEFLSVTGLVIGAFPQGEYDRRIVLLTRERGKITAFVKGGRRQGSRFLGTTDMFCFGTFELFVGKNSYTVQNVEISNYFEYFRDNLEAAYYGMYFLELADYYTRENNDEAMVLLTVYRALQGLKSDKLDNDLVRRIYEIKLLAIEGELIPADHMSVSDTLINFIDYVTEAPIQDMFSVWISDDIRRELREYTDYQRKHLVDKKLNSLEMLSIMIG